MQRFMAKRSWRWAAMTSVGFSLGGGALALAQFPQQTWPGSARKGQPSAAEVAMLLRGLDENSGAGARLAAPKAPEPSDIVGAPAPVAAPPLAPALNDAAGAGVPIVPVAADKEMAAEVLASGPIHEAFANPTALNPQPGLIVPKKPADAIEELPPAQKPEGKQVEWIPGYWAWEEQREDFIWISGVWRDIPPGRRWVPGYWGETTGGWQWTPGFWAAADQEEIEYQPAPPESLEVGPSSEAPSDGHFWVPGSWVWQDVRYSWRPGYWWAASPDWCWVPHYYSWTPRGYVLCGGYWDWLVARRGICYSPVYYSSPVYASVGYTWTPSVCFDVGALHISLFARPNYCHYYYGNYYEPWCARSGIYYWSNYHRRRGCYDPIYAHHRWDHVNRRHDRDWEHRVHSRYEHFVANADARPARTYAEAVAWRNRGEARDRDQLETLRAVRTVDELARDNRLATRLQNVDERNREDFRRGGRDFQRLANDRGDVELRRSPRDRDTDRDLAGNRGNRGENEGDIRDRDNRGRPGGRDIAGENAGRPDRGRPGSEPSDNDRPGANRPGGDRPGNDRSRENAATGGLRMPRPRDIDAARARGSAPATRPDGSPRVDRGPRRPGGDAATRPDGITATPDSNVSRPDRPNRPDRPSSRPDVARPEVTRPDRQDRPDIARPGMTRPEVARPGVTRPEVTRPDATRPEVTRPSPETRERPTRPDRPSVSRPNIERPSVERPSVERPRPTPRGDFPSTRDRQIPRESRPSIRESAPPSRDSGPPARESRPSPRESRPSVDRSPPRVDRGPDRSGGGESRPSRGPSGDRPSPRSRSDAAPRPDVNRARNEATRSAMADAARARAASRPAPSAERSAPAARASRPAPSGSRSQPSVSRSAPARVVPDRTPPQRSSPSFQRPSGGGGARHAPPPRQGGNSGSEERRRDRRK